MARSRQLLKEVPRTGDLEIPAPENRVGREDEGLTLHDGPGEAYNEDAFQYFLEIERKRSEQSARPFLMMLVDFRNDPSAPARIDDRTADALFSALSHSVRETDFIGWYRERRIAGAVLTQNEGPESAELVRVVRDRLTKALLKTLPQHLADGLQVRIYELPSNADSRGES